MRTWFVGGILLTFLWSTYPLAGEKPIVAVFDIEDQGVKLPHDLLERLSTYLATRLAESAGYQVVPRADIKTRLQSEKKDTYKECYDQSCQIELGREMAAEKTVSGQVIKLGSKCAMTVTLYDLKKATTEAAATSARGACTEDGIVDMLDEVAQKLARHEIPSVAKESQNPPPVLKEPSSASPPNKEITKADFVGRWDFLHSGRDEFQHCGEGNLTAYYHSKFWIEFTLDSQGDLVARMENNLQQRRDTPGQKMTLLDHEQSFPGREVRKEESGVRTFPTRLQTHYYSNLKVVEVKFEENYAQPSEKEDWMLWFYWFVLSPDGRKLAVFKDRDNYDRYKTGKLTLDQWIQFHLVERQEHILFAGDCKMTSLTYAMRKE
jgi:hypothetical protein